MDEGKLILCPDRETFERMRDLLTGILENTRTVHLDMGGKHKYALTHKAYPIISEAIVFMAEQYETEMRAEGRGSDE